MVNLRLLFALLLAGCLIDREAWQDARDRLTDADGDGVAAGSDCDDQDAERYPGASERWYDGVDQDCLGGDDNDADGDGDPDQAHGGTDCDDQDPSVSGEAKEGWTDLGVDNDCDGELTEAVLFPLSRAAARIEGPSASAAFGERLMVTPEGWVSDEAWLLASAALANDTTGTTYGWPASDLLGNPEVETAPLTQEGTRSGDAFGYGLGWSGDLDSPQTWVSAEGVNDGRGEIYGWRGESLIAYSSPDWTIGGDQEGDYAGYQLTEGYDHDADGVADLVVSAPLASDVAAYAGKAFLFEDPPTLPDQSSTEDADVVINNETPGALMYAWRGGDLDGDGRDDLVVWLTDLDDVVIGGSYIITDFLKPGTYDIQDVFALKVFGTANFMKDIDLDGHPELIATSKDVYRYELPKADVRLNAEADADVGAYFSFAGEGNWLWRGEVDSFGGTNRMVVASPHVPNGDMRGRVFLLPIHWEGDMKLDELDLRLDGELAGDAAGTDVVLLPDLNGDNAREIAIGAPGADGGGAGAGRVYIAEGPR